MISPTDMRKTMNLIESSSERARQHANNLDLSFNDVAKIAGPIARELVADYQEYVQDGGSRPASPDTGKFTATTSGMIDYVDVVNYTENIHQRTAYKFIKIGSNVDSEIRDEIEQAYKTAIMDELGMSTQHHNTITNDDVQFSIGGPSGSSWGGIGIIAKQL